MKRLSSLPLFALLLLSLLTQCSAASDPMVWGVRKSVLARELGDGNYNALQHVQLDRHRLEEILELGADAPYAVGLIYRDLGLDELAIRLFQLAWNESPEPYRRRALDRLVLAYRAAESYELLQQLGREARELYTDDPAATAVLTAGLYGNAEYEAVVDELSSFLPDAREALPPHNLVLQEALVWDAVSRARHNPSGEWKENVREFFRDFPATEMHVRLRLFLIYEELYSSFSGGERSYFTAKQLLASGDFDEAATLFNDLASAKAAGERAHANAEASAEEYLTAPYGVFDYFRAAGAAGSTALQVQAADNLIQLAPRVPRDATARTYEYAGRLYRAAGRFPEAIATLETALENLVPGESDRRIRWYWLSSRVRYDPAAVASEIGVIVPTLDDPDYFADVLIDLGEQLIENLAWDLLKTAYLGIADFAPDRTLARYELVLGRLYALNLLPASGAQSERLQEQYLTRAAEQTEDRFSAMIAATLLGWNGIPALDLADAQPTGAEDPPPETNAADTTPADEPSPDEPTPQQREHADALARTLMKYGLYERLLDHLRSSRAAVPPETALQIAEELTERGKYREGVVALNYYEAAGGAFTAPVARLRYPRAFAAIIDASAEREDVDPWVLYALSREESLFQPEVVSVAGAVGLMQLLPDTAADIARRMRMDEAPDLTDPTDNVAIGARYFSMLTEQFGTPARAIAAYNGGQGNVRRWERATVVLDELLFHQLIPFQETFDHVRKVVVSASYYGYLYAERAPAETVALIFDLILE